MAREVVGDFEDGVRLVDLASLADPTLVPQTVAFTLGGREARWETIDPGTYEYIPFNAGPRRCIGAGFSMMEIKTVLAMLLQRYRVECVPRLKMDRFGFPVISPKGGLPMDGRPSPRQAIRAGRGRGEG